MRTSLRGSTRECVACRKGPEEGRPVLQYVAFDGEMWDPFKAHADCAGTTSPIAQRPKPIATLRWRSKNRSKA